MPSIVIDKRYCGPPNSGNGGYVCGRLAAPIQGGAEVTLRAPPPLGQHLDAISTDGPVWELRHDAKVIATARPASVDLARLETASFDEARAAEANTLIKPHEHLLPTCFVCGPARAQGDGLRIFPGLLERQPPHAPAVFAASWTPAPDLAADDGRIAPEFLWASLDCPTGYASSLDRKSGGFDRTPILLGRMSARIDARPLPEERCVITAWEAGRDGRKRFGEAALHGENGALLAVARATWIAVDRDIQLGRA